MIRLYFDWNVISQMKNGYFPILENILEGEKNFFIPYSTSHIDDILSSHEETLKQKEIINSDLKYLSKITKNRCLLLTSTGDIILNKHSPEELYEQKLEKKNFQI